MDRIPVGAQKKGRSEYTIQDYGRKLKRLVDFGIDILNPEKVKGLLAKKERWSNSTKHHYTAVYDGFLKFLNIPWEPPRYEADKHIPFIPTEKEVDQLIAGAGRKLATFFQLLKETAMRTGEAMKLKWTEIDFGRKLFR